jgi:hypothetical protein
MAVPPFSNRCQGLQLGCNLVHFREAAFGFLREDLGAIVGNFKDATRGLDQVDIQTGLDLLQLGRQTDGLFVIPSGVAVFDR